MGLSSGTDSGRARGDVTCRQPVPLSFVRRFVSSAEMVGKYESWLLDSFVQGQSNLKFCPTPQCSSVIQCAGAAGDVVCRCGGRLCWLCDQGGHHPAPCDLVRKWKIKERSDDANEIWLRARTKECPKCSVRGMHPCNTAHFDPLN